MTAATFVLNRHEDVSGVSGTGVVCEGCEFSDGAVAVRWLGEYPSTAIWGGMREMEAIHGHSGKTVVQYNDAERLVRAYQRVMPWLLSSRDRDVPITCAPHPDHGDHLRLTFKEEWAWRKWIALLDGSSFAASHEEVNGEMQHTFITNDGDVWLQYFTPLPKDDE